MNQALMVKALSEQVCSDYVSRIQLEFLRHILLNKRESLIASARETIMYMHEERGATADTSDRATQEDESSLELQVRNRERIHLRTIGNALLHIGDGRYGWCAETGEPIGLECLLARPMATYSLGSQLRRERRRLRNRGQESSS